MHKFFYPDGVIVVGASADPLRVGYGLTANVMAGFKDRCFPVNPKYDEIEGAPCYPTVSDVPEDVDLAVLFIPARFVPETLRECGRKGIRRVIIQSAGFAETGPEGQALQRECLAVAREYGQRLWGPNCMGYVNGQNRTVVSFMRPQVWQHALRPGGVSLIVQSGMLAAGYLMQILSENYFGLNLACSIGNKADVNESDILEYLAEDPHTDVVAMYLESIVDVPRFRAAVKRLDRPVILLKGGTSDLGAKAAQSHTASLAGNTEVSEGFFRQLGIHRANDFMEMMDLTKGLVQWKGKAGGRRLAVVTFSGAAGIVASDHIVRENMTLARLSPRTLERLREVYPPWMPPENPLDLWPSIERNGMQRVYEAVIPALLEDDGVEGIHYHIHATPQFMKEQLKYLAPLKQATKPVAFWLIGDSSCFREFREGVEALGASAYVEIGRGVKALAMKADASI